MTLLEESVSKSQMDSCLLHNGRQQLFFDIQYLPKTPIKVEGTDAPITFNWIQNLIVKNIEAVIQVKNTYSL